ncbi:peptide chain release factor 2 [Bacillota bacterium Meth-B3]|nr:peptide chain release factor 2 [Christensenellaceae bacterium]MEA5067334.1 peptide chain release factor 2 [Eubacteriales bacterium]
MIETDAFRQDLAAIRDMIEEAGQSLDVERLKEQLIEYQEDMAAPGFWDELERAQKVNQRASAAEARLTQYAALGARADDLDVLIELAEEADDREQIPEIEAELKALKTELDSLKLMTLLSGKHDDCDCILALHAGAGGTEAQDWTGMLYRMYVRFCERMGFTVKELDFLDGDEAGVKSVEFEVSGDHAYGFLKSERGVHRLVRISPFDSAARRHTSFASLDVAPIIDDEGAMQIKTEDLRIDTYRSSGKGGQHVNRTDSAVRMTHLPTGLVVQCQNERSQIQNRETCLRMLRAKLSALHERERLEQMSDVKGEMKKIEWGSQIRSYVFQPYTMVKDHRTGYEMGDIDAVMDGDLEGFVTSYLQKL